MLYLCYPPSIFQEIILLTPKTVRKSQWVDKHHKLGEIHKVGLQVFQKPTLHIYTLLSDKQEHCNTFLSCLNSQGVFRLDTCFPR